MESFRKNVLLLLILSLPLIFMHCTKYKEDVPLFDGLYLRYKKISGCWEEIYQIKALKNGNFKLIKKEGCPSYKILPPPEEYIINKHGKILKSSDVRLEGDRLDIWIPPNELDGKKVPPSFGDSNAKVEKRHWRKWDVLIIKSTIAPVEILYDVSTGFKVGTITGAMPGVSPMTLVLVDTNANILIEKE